MLDERDANGEKKDHISLLPKTIAVRIFMFLGLPDLVTCSKICRSWKEITQANILWSRVCFFLCFFLIFFIENHNLLCLKLIFCDLIKNEFKDFLSFEFQSY